jgi:hypothetical protein
MSMQKKKMILHGMNKKNRKASFGGGGPSGGAYVPS